MSGPGSSGDEEVVTNPDRRAYELQESIPSHGCLNPTVTAPYPGLRPFEFVESEVFFGREAHTDRLLEILQREQFLAVIGPSGSGKSSLVRAGLLPALAMGCLGTGSDWRIATMRPGDRPLRNLAKALLAPEALGPELRGSAATEATTAVDEAMLEADLRRGPLSLLEVAAQARRVTPGFNLLVLVDQFEELFTYAGHAAADAETFVELLLPQRGRPEDRLFVALTMRTDFLGNCTRFLELPDAINRAQYLTPRLTHTQLEAAILGPARVFGGDVEPPLVAEFANAVAQTPDELPVLQHALARMWRTAMTRNPRKPHVDAACAHDVGGVKQALDQHAEEVFARLTEPQQRTAEALFCAITDTRVGEAGGQQVRRPQSLAAIAHWCGMAQADLIPVVAAFSGPSSGMLQHGATLTEHSIIDLAHESLMRQWRRLKRWVKDEAECAAAYRRWRSLARENQAGSPVWLARSDLQRAQEWLNPADQKHPWRPSEAWAQRYNEAGRSDRDAGAAFALTARYIKASQDEVERRQQERERAQTRDLLAEQNRRKARRLKKVAAALTVVVLLSTWFGYHAYQSERQAQVLRLVAESEVTESSHPDKSQDAAVRAYREIQPSMPNVDARLRAAFANAAPLRHSLRGHSGPVTGAIYSPDGQSLLTYGDDGIARRWDVATGKELPPLQGMESPSKDGAAPPRILAAAFKPDGQSVVVARALGFASVWAPDGRFMVQNTGQERPALFATFSPDRNLIFSRGYKDRARIWSLADGQSKEVLRQGDEATPQASPPSTIDDTDDYADAGPVAGAFSPDGRTIATRDTDGAIDLWNAGDGKRLWRLGNDQSRRSAQTVAFSPDGQRIVSGYSDGSAQVLDAGSGAVLHTLSRRAGPADAADAAATVGIVTAARFSPDGRFIVTTSTDQTASLWHSERGRLIAVLKGHAGSVLSAAFSPDSQSVLTTSDDGTARLWNVADGKPLKVLKGHSGALLSAAFGPDGLSVATTGDDHTARLWDLTQDQPIAFTPPRKTSANFPVTVSPDGQSIATADRDFAAVVWNTASGAIVATQQEPHGKPILAAAFSRDGKTVLTGSADGSARLWSAVDGRTIATLLSGTKGVTSVAFNPKFPTAVTAGRDRLARIWDLASGSVLQILKGHQDDILSASFSPDGKTVVTTSSDKSARLWNVADGRPLSRLTGHLAAVISATFSSDGKLLATASADNTAALWNVADGTRLKEFRGHTGAVFQAMFNRSDTQLVTASHDRSARLWSVSEGKPIAKLAGHSGPVISAAFAADGQFIVTASGDGTARVWNVEHPQEIAVLPSNGSPLRSAAIEPQHGRVVTAAEDGSARTWSCGPCAPAAELAKAIEARIGLSGTPR